MHGDGGGFANGEPLSQSPRRALAAARPLGQALLLQQPAARILRPSPLNSVQTSASMRMAALPLLAGPQVAEQPSKFQGISDPGWEAALATDAASSVQFNTWSSDNMLLEQLYKVGVWSSCTS